MVCVESDDLNLKLVEGVADAVFDPLRDIDSISGCL